MGWKVFKLKDCDETLLKNLSLKKRDVGIDIIAIDQEGNVDAVQCKFRRRGTVRWRELSTFEALCSRTGSWNKHIVMTNQEFVRREGNASAKDIKELSDENQGRTQVGDNRGKKLERPSLTIGILFFPLVIKKSVQL